MATATERADATALRGAGRAFTGESGAGAAVEEFLSGRGTAPRLLGLGEPTHGEEVFPRLRNEVFRHLVVHQGYRSIALESDCVAGLVVDDFVTKGVGSLDDVLRRGFSHGFGTTAATRDLVSWMREYNHDRPAAERLRFFGFDAPMEMVAAASPRRVLTALHDYLAVNVDNDLLPCGVATIARLIGDDARWTNPEVAMTPALGVGDSPEVGQLRLIADELAAVLATESPHLAATTSPEEYWRASMYARTALGLLRYHAGMASTAANHVSRLLGLRDAMMADNLAAIVAGQAERGPTLVFAHNRHLQREKSHWDLVGRPLEWWCAGAITHTRLGDRYAFIAADLGTAPHRGIGTPAPDTLQGLMSALPGNHHLFDSARLAAALDLSRVPGRADLSPDIGHFPLDPQHVPDTDAILFVRRTS